MLQKLELFPAVFLKVLSKVDQILVIVARQGIADPAAS